MGGLVTLKGTLYRIRRPSPFGPPRGTDILGRNNPPKAPNSGRRTNRDVHARGKAGSAAAAIGLLVFFFAAPVVPYTQAIAIPGNYRYVRATCNNEVGYFSGTTFTVSTFTEACTKPNGTLPASVVTGYGSLSSLLLGVGTEPFADGLVVSQGNLSALVYFRGGQAVSAEVLGYSKNGSLYDPPGVVAITSASFRLAQFGQLNFTATVENTGRSVLESAVYLDAPGVDQNRTQDGLTWMSPGPIGTCRSPLSVGLRPGDSCTVSGLVNVQASGNVLYHVEVRGTVNGTPFVTRQGFQQTLPTGGIGRPWVSEFIQDVNGERPGVPLVENASLDAFAAQRFESASAQPDISDYNFTKDASAFFGAGRGAGATEVLLFPGGFTPDAFASYLKTYAVGHWTALIDPGVSRYGYYIGTAPYFQVSANCPVQEVLGEGTNITQYFVSQGCRVTPVPSVIWLVIVMSP